MDFTITNHVTEQSRLIRTEVFINEQGFDNEFDDIDQRAFHLVLFIDDEPAATGRVFVSDECESTYIIGRVAVVSKFRKRNLGLSVLTKLEEVAKQHGATKIELSSQCQAEKFYAKCGYIQEGNIYFDEHCPHIKMSKSI